MNIHTHTKKEFIKLIMNNQRIIHKITFMYTDSPFDREDLFQEICLQLWKSYAGFREESKFSTWMYRVALNTAVSNLRKKRHRPVYEPLNDDTVQVKSESTDEKEKVKRLFEAVSKLGRIDKAIILLWFEKKSYLEIASITGISKSNVSVKIVRIKRKLEEMLSDKPAQESATRAFLEASVKKRVPTLHK